MPDHISAKGHSELRAAWRDSRALVWWVGGFSFCVNLLMLTGPVYMLNVYDRVLNARSVETLVALSGIMVFLFVIMAVIDDLRGRIMARAGARLQERLDRRVFGAVLDQAMPVTAATGLQDLEAVQRSIASPGAIALFDLPWVPVFFIGIFLFHPALGLMGVAGALLLLAAAVLQHKITDQPLSAAHAERLAADRLAHHLCHDRATVQALGMGGAMFARWQMARAGALNASVAAADLAGSVAAATRAFRLLLQSAMLGLGALLVLRGQLSPGAMIAASILLGRALAPVDAVLGHWPVLQRGRFGWRALAQVLGQLPAAPPARPPARLTAQLLATQVTVIPPGQNEAALRMVGFEVAAGQAVGVIGPSGAGKTALAQALTGVWPLAAGQIRLGDVVLGQDDPDDLGRQIGYLPQQVHLYEGSLRANIARMAVAPDDRAVIAAARVAGVHDLILGLRHGYDTQVGAGGAGLSGGQIQRIGLARALYGDPVLVVLDEPNAHLDNDGALALNSAIRHIKAAGGIVFVMAHRPGAIQDCDLLLVLEQGRRRAFGPRDRVLAETVQNDAQIRARVLPVGLA